MSLPSLDKTGGAAWQFGANQPVGGSGAVLGDNQDCMYKIKNLLKGFGSSAWTCWGSCNGAGGFGNGDSNDRWLSSANLVWAAAGSNHSWIVLQQAGLGAKTAVCIDLNNANSYNATITFSPVAGFGTANGGADGTATAAPTASDGIALISGSTWGGSTAAYYTKGLHAMQSSDGQCSRVILCMANVCSGLWIFEKAKNPITPWTAPVFAGAVGSSASAEVATYANWNDTAKGQTKIGGATVALFMTSAFYGTATIGENQTFPDDNTQEWPINDIGLASTTASHRGGRKGQVFDLWWGSTAVPAMTTYPEDGTKQLVQFGHLIFPWNGSVPKMA